MADANELVARDITISDSPSVNPQGQTILMRTVQFFVGNHGPFYLTDRKENLTGKAIADKINAEIQDLRVGLSSQG